MKSLFPLSGLKGPIIVLLVAITALALYAGRTVVADSPRTALESGAKFAPVFNPLAKTYSPFNVSGASVVTDKADYRPGEVVQITGSGFGAGDVITLQVADIGPAPGFAAA